MNCRAKHNNAMNCGLNIMNCRVKHNPVLKRRGGNLHPRTVIYRHLCLARHFSAGSVMQPSARGFNPMHSPVFQRRGANVPAGEQAVIAFLILYIASIPAKRLHLKINPIIIRNTACAIQKNTIFAAIFSRIRQHNV